MEGKEKSILNLRKNIISWYPFDKDSTILEINGNCKEITEILEENSSKLLSIDIKDIEKIDIIEKFDYIVLIGLEKIDRNWTEILKTTNNLLKPNGKLLVAMDNKYSLKNFSSKEGIERILDKNVNEIKIDEFIEQIKETGFNNYKIYYPITDYKYPNAIFADNDELYKNITSRNIVYNSEENIKFFEENKLMMKLLEDTIDFRYFANSFFIEIFKGDFTDNEIKLITFSNIRKNKYKIRTIVKNDFVYKYADNQESKNHIEQVKKNIDILNKYKLNTLDSYDKDKIISRYVENDTFEIALVNTIKENKDKAIELIKKYKEKLEKSLEKENTKENVFDRYSIKYNEEIIKDMKFTKYGLWDLTFQNCFYIDNDFYFYDQEWLEEDIPIEFIIYRAIKYCIDIRNYVDIEELYNILDINKNQIEIFDQLDDIIQEKYRDNDVWQLQKNGKMVDEMQIEIYTKNHEINLLSAEIERKNGEIERKNMEIENLKTEYEKIANNLQIIYNSKSWKMLEPFRKIRKLIK